MEDLGRLLCVTCAPRGASLYDWACSDDLALMAVDLDGVLAGRGGDDSVGMGPEGG